MEYVTWQVSEGRQDGRGSSYWKGMSNNSPFLSSSEKQDPHQCIYSLLTVVVAFREVVQILCRRQILMQLPFSHLLDFAKFPGRSATLHDGIGM